MYKQKTFAQTVREKYGDSLEEFAFRMCVSRSTVKKWEDGKKPGALHMALLLYANEHELAMKPEAPEWFRKLDATGKMKCICGMLRYTIGEIAIRLKVEPTTAFRWKRDNKMARPAERLVCEYFVHPDKFE